MTLGVIVASNFF